jgi:hypothetical protein
MIISVRNKIEFRHPFRHAVAAGNAPEEEEQDED